MPDPPHPTRRYDEQRTDAILRRAAELQASGGAAGSTDRRLTLLPALAAGLALAVISGSYVLARTVFTATVRRRSRQLHSLLERIIASCRTPTIP